MTDGSKPEPPDGLPKYLRKGLPKQDDETLQATRNYIDAVLEWRSEPIETDELPEGAEPVEEASDRKGTVVKERVKCGDENCACTSGNPGDMHGPYLYRYYREKGTLKSEYIGKP